MLPVFFECRGRYKTQSSHRHTTILPRPRGFIILLEFSFLFPPFLSRGFFFHLGRARQQLSLGLLGSLSKWRESSPSPSPSPNRSPNQDRSSPYGPGAFLSHWTTTGKQLSESPGFRRGLRLIFGDYAGWVFMGKASATAIRGRGKTLGKPPYLERKSPCKCGWIITCNGFVFQCSICFWEALQFD